MQDEKTIEFLKKLKDSGYWNDDYDYSQLIYVNNYTNVIVINKKTNLKHFVSPKTLLKGGGCHISNSIDKFVSYKDFKLYVKKIGINSRKSWLEFCKTKEKPFNIPVNPNKVYINQGWISWEDCFGNKFFSFEDARKFMKKIGLKSQKEWVAYCKEGLRPNNIPAHPSKIYKYDGYISLGHFLGYTESFLSFYEAREIVRSLNIKNCKEWYLYCKSNKKQNNIPSSPNAFYKDKGWISWGDFLGNEKLRGIEFVSYEECKKFVQSLSIKTQKEWRAYCKSGLKPNNIPSNPNRTYSNKKSNL